MRFHGSAAGMLRDDWLELDLSKVVAGLQRPVVAAPRQVAATAALSGARRELQQQTAELVAQRQQMQLQLAQMHKQLSQMQDRRIDTGEAAPEGAVARLSMLDKLLREKLITQQEYDAKRKEILGQL